MLKRTPDLLKKSGKLSGSRNSGNVKISYNKMKQENVHDMWLEERVFG